METLQFISQPLSLLHNHPPLKCQGRSPRNQIQCTRRKYPEFLSSQSLLAISVPYFYSSLHFWATEAKILFPELAFPTECFAIYKSATICLAMSFPAPHKKSPSKIFVFDQKLFSFENCSITQVKLVNGRKNGFM